MRRLFSTPSPLASLQRRYRWALSLVPVACVLCGFGLNFALIPYLTDLSSQYRGYRFLLITAFIAFMATMILVNYSIGWAINAALARWVYRWPNERVLAVFWRCEFPREWHQESVGDSPQSVAEQRWREQSKHGLVHFVITRGMISWGMPMFFGMHALPVFLGRRKSTFQGNLTQLGIWMIAGLLFGLFMWFSTKRTFDKKKPQNPDAA